MKSHEYKVALECLRSSLSHQCFVASNAKVANYQRVWARDAVVCGLSALLSKDSVLCSAFANSLEKLASCQGPEGQIPSNILLGQDGKIESVSYGGLCGRVDSIAWYVIGVCNYAALNDDYCVLEHHLKTIHSSLQLLKSWEFNARGLVYMPQGGDWADEYLFHGYVLLIQVLRYWAINSLAKLTNEKSFEQESAELAERIVVNYLPKRETHPEHFFHPKAAKLYLDDNGDAPYLLAALTPGKYFSQFDFLSNAIAILAGLASGDATQSILRSGQEVIDKLATSLAPAFWPVIDESMLEWSELEANYLAEFKNKPFEYHNGGIWPMVSGWWGAALASAGKLSQARILQGDLNKFNKQHPEEGMDWGFFEHGNSTTGKGLGTPFCAWSAAAPILLEHALSGDALFYG